MKKMVSVAAATIALMAALPATAASLVVPGAQTSAEGNSGSRNLFGFINVSRFQQVYGASEFTGGPVTLTGFSLRTNGAAFSGLFGGPGTAFSRTIADISFSLSTTARAVDGLSTNFADNVGADATAVIARGSQTYSSAAGSANATTRDFDIFFSFDTPFLFDPSQGNLLLDVINFSGGNVTSSNGTTLDAQFTQGDSVSSLYGSNRTSGTGTASTLGYITQFQTAAGVVPEPSTWAMMIVGFGMIGGSMRYRRRSTKIAYA